ncbi:MAG TPA: C4-dicarboxylate ABC transporter, partial [Burkholderiales bacterium]|nr:C4-dicarboxylate ABC transporter [Burkholderiales bacterium]
MRAKAVAVAVSFAFCVSASAQAPKSIKMQSTWPASNTLQEHFKIFAERTEKLTQGSIRVDAMPAGQVVPAFEVLDATH